MHSDLRSRGGFLEEESPEMDLEHQYGSNCYHLLSNSLRLQGVVSSHLPSPQ